MGLSILIKQASSEGIHRIETTSSKGSLFTKSYPDWREGTSNLFDEWSLQQLGVKEPVSEDEGEVPVHLRKAKSIEFALNSRGHFILPPLNTLKRTQAKQRMVRAYIGAVYSM